MAITATAKSLIRAGLGAPGARDALRWFINEPRFPIRWRELAHRKLAKRARFSPAATFSYHAPNGTSLRFLHRGTPNYLYWRNTYEPDTMRLFCHLAPRARVILDIGASDGVFAILAAAANPTARILAFEPGVDAARACQRNVEINGPTTRNVDVLAIALADADRDGTLFVAGESGGISSLNPTFRMGSREQRVAVRRGDAIVAERGIERVDLAKIDTESTEPAVLRGLANTLERDHPDLICEVLQGRTERELSRLLDPLGYRYYRITERGLRPQSRLEGDAMHRDLNYFFTVRDEPELRRIGLTITAPL